MPRPLKMTLMSKYDQIDQLADRYLISEKGTPQSAFLLAEIFATIDEISDETKNSINQLKKNLNQINSLIS